MRVLSSLKASPRGASHRVSRALTWAPCCWLWQSATMSSAYAESRVMPTELLEGLPGGQVVVLGAA
jgi:hypothetical protein